MMLKIIEYTFNFQKLMFETADTWLGKTSGQAIVVWLPGLTDWPNRKETLSLWKFDLPSRVPFTGNMIQLFSCI